MEKTISAEQFIKDKLFGNAKLTRVGWRVYEFHPEHLKKALEDYATAVLENMGLRAMLKDIEPSETQSESSRLVCVVKAIVTKKGFGIIDVKWKNKEKVVDYVATKEHRHKEKERRRKEWEEYKTHLDSLITTVETPFGNFSLYK